MFSLNGMLFFFPPQDSSNKAYTHFKAVEVQHAAPMYSFTHFTECKDILVANRPQAKKKKKEKKLERERN